MDDVIEVLASVDIFKDIDRDGLASIAVRCRRDRYHDQQTIFGYGDVSADVYFIASGRVGITMFSLSGKEIAFRQSQPGDMFGEIAAIDHEPRSTSVVSRSELDLIRLTDSDFRDVLSEMPEVAMRVMQRLSFLVRSLSERIVEFTTLDVRHRIHAELLRLVKAQDDGRSQRTATETVNIYPAPTHAEIANQVSTHREAVTREFRLLAKDGILEKRGRNLIVRDVPSLERLVKKSNS